MKHHIARSALLVASVLTLSACMNTPHHPQVTAPPTTVPNPVTPPIAQPDPTVPQQQYVVQLTASSSPVKAEGLKNLFAGDGYNAFVSPLLVNGRLLHRVQIGYFDHEPAAKIVLAQLKQQYPQDIYVAEAVVKTP